MCEVGNYGRTSEFGKAQEDFKESREATRHAAEHFAKAQEQFAAADRDYARGNILGGLLHSAEANRQLEQGREDLADASEAREHGFEHIVNGMEQQAVQDIGLGGFGAGAFGGYNGGLGPNIDPGFNPWGGGFDGSRIDPGFTPRGLGEFDGRSYDPGFFPAVKLNAL